MKSYQILPENYLQILKTKFYFFGVKFSKLRIYTLHSQHEVIWNRAPADCEAEAEVEAWMFFFAKNLRYRL